MSILNAVRVLWPLQAYSHNFVFPLVTVRENIGYGASATFDEIVEASKVANAHSFINSFPNKYDEDVGERGMNLR